VDKGSARKQPAADQSRETLLFFANRGPMYLWRIGAAIAIVESTYISSQGTVDAEPRSHLLFLKALPFDLERGRILN
jgi:hypothetical protein